MKPELLTISQFCDIANIGRTYTYDLLSRGEIEGVKLGKKTLIRRSVMEAWLETLKPYYCQSKGGKI